MTSDRYNLLFVDKENASLSILAEKLMQHWGRDRFKAYSAGITPATNVDPLAIELLHSKKLDVDDLKSKSWVEFTGKDAPHFDFVITLSEDNEIKMPVKWAGNPIVAHWNLHDSLSDGTHQKDRVFCLRRRYSFLENRIKIFSNLKLNKFSKVALSRELNAISNYKLNDELLDNEHYLFFFLVQYLNKAAKEDKSHDVLINIALEIQKYAEFHFFSEENYMEAAGFPGLQEHCALHTSLMSDLNEKVFKLRVGQATFSEVSVFLDDWFLGHVVQEDVKFVDFVAHQKGAS